MRELGSGRGSGGPDLSSKASAIPGAVLFAVREARVSESGSDRHHAPALDVAHERHLAQALHHRVVMRERHQIVTVDGRDGRAQKLRKVEAPVLPVARQILAARLDRSVLTMRPGHPIPMKGASFNSSLSARLIMLLSILTRRLIASSRLGVLSACRHNSACNTLQLDDSDANIGAANVNGENAVMA